MNFLPILPDDVSVAYKPPVENVQCSFCSADKAGLKCSRCLKARYCNRECQVSHWKTHKIACVSYKAEGLPKSIPTSRLIDGTKPPTAEDRKAMKKIIAEAKAGVKGPNDSICTTCTGLSKCISVTEHPSPGGGNSASAAFVCGNGHMSAVTDVRFSLQQDCNCNIEVNETKAPLTSEQERAARELISPQLRVLIVTGFGQFNTTNSCYFRSLLPRLDSETIPYDVIQANNGSALTRSLMSRRYNSLIFLHLDDKGFEKNMEMFGGAHLGTLFHWINFGGRFILHGEGDYVSQLLQSFVGKPWHYCGDYYRRIKHHNNRETFRHFPLRSTASVLTSGMSDMSISSSSAGSGASEGATAASGGGGGEGGGDSEDDETTSSGQPKGCWLFPKTINTKATMLCGVAPEDRLYSPKPGARCISNVPGFGGHVVNHDRTAVAYSPRGHGSVCYVGDVNAEPKTIDMIIALLRK